MMGRLKNDQGQLFYSFNLEDVVPSERFDVKPERVAADSAYGSAANLNWLVTEKKITPHIPVIDKSKREDGHLLAGRLHLRQGQRYLHLRGGQSSYDNRQDRE